VIWSASLRAFACALQFADANRALPKDKLGVSLLLTQNDKDDGEGSVSHLVWFAWDDAELQVAFVLQCHPRGSSRPQGQKSQTHAHAAKC
jgi:hypothetical protein